MSDHYSKYSISIDVSTYIPSNDTNYTSANNASLAQKARGATIVSPIIFCSCGIIGNSLAIWILSRKKQGVHKTMFYTLVAGLAWTDLIGIIITTPVTLASYINGVKLPGGRWLCNFNGFTMTCFGLITPLIVFVMAIERVMAIKYSFYYSKFCNRSAARTIIIILWTLTLIFGMLPLFGFGAYLEQYPGTWCFLEFHKFDCISCTVYAFIYAFSNSIILLGMIGCNIYVIASLMELEILKLRRSSSSSNVLKYGTPEHQPSLRRSSSVKNDIKKQMVYLVIILTTIFVLCWAPLMIQIIVTLSKRKTNKWMDLLAVRLASLNQTLDPWFYIIIRKSCIDRIKVAFTRVHQRIAKLMGKRQKYRVKLELNGLKVEENNSLDLKRSQANIQTYNRKEDKMAYNSHKSPLQVSPDITIRLICSERKSPVSSIA